MGLDMYLQGRKVNFTDWEKPEGKRCPMMDGFEVQEHVLQLGYWRKHPNLHGAIVQMFADGKDECQDIYLDKEKLEKLIQAVKDNNLPETEGFFFGKSEDPNEQNTIEQLEGALKWLQTKEHNVSRSVVYRASW